MLTSQIVKSSSKESEAFAATVDQFEISLREIAVVSKVSQRAIEAFKDGDTKSLKSSALSAIIYALHPHERTYYAAMIAVQHATEDARIPLPLLTFEPIGEAPDIYRQAIDKLQTTFSLDMAFISRSSKVLEPNITRWRKGRSDFEVDSIDKLKGAMTTEQRNFFLAIVDILYALNVPNKQTRSAQTHLALSA